MKYITLASKQTIPALGLGTWESPESEIKAAVTYAILEAGYRHLDCAAAYGNEPAIGQALKQVFKKVDREKIFITSKLWNTNHQPQNVVKACKQTLSDLNLEYLDLYLMHWSIAFKASTQIAPLSKDGIVQTESVSVRETWTAMEELVQAGLVKNIGVANFSGPLLLDLLTYAKVSPAMNQIELHPYNTQQALVDFCHRHHIAVTAYSPLGRLGARQGGHKLIEEQIILSLAKKYKKTPVQILLNWAINRETIAIPKSTNLQRIRENIEIFDFSLTDSEQSDIDVLNQNYRFVNPNQVWGVPIFE